MSLTFQYGFSEVVLLFFFLFICEILSPVCPPKISFKKFSIDTQLFTQYKYRLRGQINILHREVGSAQESDFLQYEAYHMQV